MGPPTSALRSSAKRTTAFSPRGQLHRRRGAAEADLCALRALAPRHAKIKSIKKDKALKAPGVVAVFTGDDLAGAKVNGLPCGWLITDVNGQPMKEPPHPVSLRARRATWAIT